MSTKKATCIECGKPAIYTRFHCSPECKELSPTGIKQAGVLRSIKGGKKKGAAPEPDPMATMFQQVLAAMGPMLERFDAASLERTNREAFRAYAIAYIAAGEKAPFTAAANAVATELFTCCAPQPLKPPETPP